jgi:soluble lytic murein transglycosylase-like protein
MRTNKALKMLVILCASLFISVAQAKVYFYKGPDGEKLVSDRPIRGYKLVSQRDTVRNAGYILANRPISSEGPTKFKSYIHSASQQFGVDPALVEAVIQVESGFDPNAISHKGATGLMQLMKATANQYQVKDRHNPRENINAGVAHLRHLMDRFNGKIPLVLAAYNAGASAVEKYGGIPPYPETRRYVSKVIDFHSQYRLLRYGLE